MQSNSVYRPGCLLAHSLVNKLSIIVGQCDLLHEKAPEDPECLRRLLIIRDLAKSIAKELNEHQCHLDEITRKEAAKKPSLRAEAAKS